MRASEGARVRALAFCGTIAARVAEARPWFTLSGGALPGRAGFATISHMTTATLLTARDFALLPDPVHGGKMELVRGRPTSMPPVGPDHGRNAARTTRHLDQFSEGQSLGEVRVETGYWLTSGPDDVRAPDVSFVSSARLPGEEVVNGFVTQAPDLAVEVVSPNDRESEIADKVDTYLAAGVQRVWVVRPEQKTVTVHRPGGDSHTYRIGDALSSDDATFSVPGFSLPLAELFG